MKERNTTSLCPECLRPLDARVFEENGKVMIEKECPKHGKFKNTYWSDVNLYDQAKNSGYIGEGIVNPQTEVNKGCPNDCGLCGNHESHTILGLIDVTNRCNLKCPVCFANAAVSKKIYEPSFEEIRKMLRKLRDNKPVQTPAIQYAGGEPTVRKDIIELIELAKEEGFTHIQIATNGIKIAKDEDFPVKLKEAGLNTVYMQFDGLTERPYIINRGKNILPEKLKAIENCRKAGLGMVLVPTLVKGVNDQEVGDIIRFAVENIDVIHGITFQPISFSGRTPSDQVEEQRITIPDFVKLVDEQTDGQIDADDFYSASAVAPVSEFIQAIEGGKPQVTLTCHQHCGGATYVFVEDDKIIPITNFIDVEKFLKLLEYSSQILENDKGIKGKVLLANKIRKELPKTYNNEKAPKNIDVADILKDIFQEHSYDSLGTFHTNSLLISCMHFMDPFNFDTRRVRRCVINYATPDGRIIPFCTMNSLYREKIENKFAIPIEEYRNK